MKLLVISDSHGARDNLARFALLAHRLHADTVIHLGDHADDLSPQALPCPLITVRGNCDWISSVPQQRMERFDGVETLLCHGHLFGVKSGLGMLEAYAGRQGAALALFGHTHQSVVARRAGVLLVNPGTAQSVQFPSCAQITIQNAAVTQAEILTF